MEESEKLAVTDDWPQSRTANDLTTELQPPALVIRGWMVFTGDNSTCS